MHVARGSGQRLGVAADSRRRLFRQRTRRAIHRDHAIALLVAGLRRVVRPLEGLERMLMAVGVFDTGGRADAGKRLVAAQPDHLAFGEVGALNGKAHQAFRVSLSHIERENYDIGAADNTDRDKTENFFGHITSP